MGLYFGVFSKSYIFASLLKRECIGRLAQLVQSICLTSRGSAVRTRQRPHRFLVLNTKRAFSSAGSEHLPYKQRVGGSNPSTPTSKKTFQKVDFQDFICDLSLCDLHRFESFFYIYPLFLAILGHIK